MTNEPLNNLKMTTKETIEILETFNKWRRGDESIEMPSPTLIGKAIDSAIEKLKNIEDESKDLQG